MKNHSLRRIIAWLVVTSMTLTQATQVAALTLASSPLAASTTSVVRPNLMYVLDDSGSMAWDFTPDYINDATVAVDPGSQAGAAGDGIKTTISGGHVATVVATSPPFNTRYTSAPSVIILGGGGTGASATVNFAAGAFPKVISSISVTSGGNGYTSAPFAVLVGGLNTASWGMCWGTTGTSNQGGVPKDTVASPTCTTNSQLPYATSAINYQYYDPAVRYALPVNANGSNYTAYAGTAAPANGFAGSGSPLNLTTSWQHEVWCNVSAPSPAPTAANIATHAQCKENTDTSSDNLYPNLSYNFRKTYNGPASYYTASPAEYCADTDLTNCVSSTAPTVVGGITFNIPALYRWCSFYNALTHTYGNCQARRDLTHYVPNYLGGWVSTGSAGAQAAATMTINSFTVGQRITSLKVGTTDIVGGASFTAGAADTTTTVATAVCDAINLNASSSGYGCARTNNSLLIQAGVVGTAPNGQEVVAAGPPDALAANSTGEIRVLTAPADFQISSIMINRLVPPDSDGSHEELLGGSVTAAGTVGLTAKAICDAINAGPQKTAYKAFSGSPIIVGPATELDYGTCNDTADAFVGIKRLAADTRDNGATISVSGPAAATQYTGSIIVNSTGGATRIDDIRVNGVSILSSKPLVYPSGAIPDGLDPIPIAADIASKISGAGCTATANQGTVIITGSGPDSIPVGTCNGALTVVGTGVASTGKFRVTGGATGKGGDLAYIKVNGTTLAGHITSTQLTNTNLAFASANATVLKNAIAGGFTAAAPVASGGGNYDVTVTAPAGNTYNGYSFDFGTGSDGGLVAGTSPTWTFDFTGATIDNSQIASITCGGTATVLANTASTGAPSSAAYIANLSTGVSTNGLNGRSFGGYSYTCTSAGSCTLTGPPGAAACLTPTVSKDATITLGSWNRTSAGSSATPTWTFNITGATSDSKAITSITCNGTNVIRTSSTSPVSTVSTGTPSAYIANLTSNVGGLNGKSSGTSPNNYSWSCPSAGSCTLTGPVGVAACTTLTTSAPGITATSGNASGGTADVPGFWTFSITDATTDSMSISQIRCGNSGSGGSTSFSSGLRLLNTAASTGTSTAQSYAQNLATSLMSSFDPDGGTHWTNGNSSCTANAGAGTVACTFRKTAPACSSTPTITFGSGANSGLTLNSGPTLSGTDWSFTLGGATAANRTVVSITCPEPVTTNVTTTNGAVTGDGGGALTAPDLATDIIATLNTTYWNRTSSSCTGTGSSSGDRLVSCSLVPVGAGICTSSPTVNRNGVTVSAIGGSSAAWTFSLTGINTGDGINSITCPSTSNTVFRAVGDNTGSTGTVTTQAVQRMENLRTGLDGQSRNSFTTSCPTAATAGGFTCTVQGPATCTAPTLHFLGSSGSTGISVGATALTNAGQLMGSYTAAVGGTRPTWTYSVTGPTSGTASDNLPINSITCSGTNTFNTASKPNTGTYTFSRINNLGTTLASNGINSYTTSCSPTLTSTSSPMQATCTITGPTGAAACGSMVLSRDGSITADASPAQTNAGSTSPTWTFSITGATDPLKNISSIQCGSDNTFDTSALPSTGASSFQQFERVNNLTKGGTTGLESIGRNSYTYSCTTATSTSNPLSTCTVTGPVGVAACTNLSISAGSGISTANMTQLTTGSAATFSVEDFAQYLSTVTPFSGGTSVQSTTPTANVAGTATGTIDTSTVNMTNGSPTSSQTIPTNATGSPPDVLVMGSTTLGSDPDLSTNHWTGVGVFKRVDIVPATTTYNRSFGRTDCTSSTCTYAEELQNFSNWYTYYRTREQMMKSATTQAFTQLNGNYRVGYDNICNATGTTVQQTVAQFVDSGGEVANQRTNWWSRLTSATPSCATPLRAETAKIGKYYGHKLGTVADPLQYSCQQNFMILVTDGYWNENEPSSTSLTASDIGNVDNTLGTVARPFYDGQQASTTCPGTGTGRGLNASSCRTLSDIAWYYYSTDLRTSALSNDTGVAGVDVATNNVQVTSDDANQGQHMNFFAMGLGIDGSLNYRSDYQTAGVGDFADIRAGTANWPAVSNLDPTAVDDLWHATVNGHGKYFSARNLPAVVSGLREALNKIGSRVGSASAAATSNLEPVNGDNFAYVASFATSFWVGDLQSRSIDLSTGDVSPDTNCGASGSGCQWSAQAELDDVSWPVRRIFAAPTSNTSGDPLRLFNFTNLTATEKGYFDPAGLSALYTTPGTGLIATNATDTTAENLVNFLRGDRSLEQDGNGGHAQIWRQRAHVLGDIVNTQPIFMKAPNLNYTDAGYGTFKTSGTASTRRPVVFVSAQDGMLHAFNADTSSVTVSGNTVDPGGEMWAYIPKQSMQAMRTLADANYVHRYFVDGPITISDANFGSGTNDWHTILVAGQGAGGTSFFALDVTDPLNPLYLWEFTDSRLGNTISNSTITKLPNGEWAVIFTSGYGNVTGEGYLFALDPKTGALKSGYPISNLSGDGTTPSNLGKMAVRAIDPALNNTVQYVYAGDLKGDLWRFDFDPSASGHSGTSVFKLAHLSSATGVQPITTKPEVTLLPNGTQAVYVGTGKYLETPDLSNSDPQAFYAIKDTLGLPNLGGGGQTTWDPLTDTVTVSSSSVPAFLQRKFISVDSSGQPLTRVVNGVTQTVRAVCSGSSSTVTAGTNLCANEDPTVMDWGTYGGWYVNFPDTGERMNVDMKLVLGTLVFASNIPQASSCTVGGSAVGSQLDFQTGLGIVTAQGVAASNIVGVRITNSLVVGVTVIKLGDGSYKSINTLSDTSTRTLDVDVCTSSWCGQGGTGGGNTGGFMGNRGLWREFEAY